jgi:hypothetical protein
VSDGLVPLYAPMPPVFEKLPGNRLTPEEVLGDDMRRLTATLFPHDAAGHGSGMWDQGGHMLLFLDGLNKITLAGSPGEKTRLVQRIDALLSRVRTEVSRAGGSIRFVIASRYPEQSLELGEVLDRLTGSYSSSGQRAADVSEPFTPYVLEPIDVQKDGREYLRRILGTDIERDLWERVSQTPGIVQSPLYLHYLTQLDADVLARIGQHDDPSLRLTAGRLNREVFKKRLHDAAEQAASQSSMLWHPSNPRTVNLYELSREQAKVLQVAGALALRATELGTMELSDEEAFAVLDAMVAKGEGEMLYERYVTYLEDDQERGSAEAREMVLNRKYARTEFYPKVLESLARLGLIEQ